MARQWLELRKDWNYPKLAKWLLVRSLFVSGRALGWLTRETIKGFPVAVELLSLAVEKVALALTKITPGIRKWAVLSQVWLDDAFAVPDRGVKRILDIIDAQPFGGLYFDLEGSEDEPKALPVSLEDIKPITNIREATKGRHLIILGDTGTGKTTTAQYVAVENSVLSNTKVNVRVYDCEGMFKLLPGWELVGAGEDFDAINESMSQDLEELSQFFQSGQPEAKEPTHIYIGEEFPDITDQCKVAPQWCDRHSRRGRKAGRFLILISQYDQIAAFGFEGKSGLMKNFRVLRLGEFALTRAKQLKSKAIEEWLKQSKSHCLLGDEPLKLPAYEEMVRAVSTFSLGFNSVSHQSHQSESRVVQQASSSPLYNPIQSHNGHNPVLTAVQPSIEKTAENAPRTTENQGFQLLETDFSGTAGGGEIALLEGILSRLRGGDSADKVAKWVKDNYSVGYARARALVDTALRLLGEG
jgi:DNA polymerase III delta prime subunit